MRNRITGLLVILMILFGSWKHSLQQENSVPVLKILNPQAGSEQAWNTQIRYAITVSDKEDGESKFDEIPANEVMLRVKFLADSNEAKSYIEQKDPFEAGFLEMRKSNCFNCHALKSTLIGPPFRDIARKYQDPDAEALLARHVKEGSTNVWGPIPMPAHPELSDKQIADMIQWITNNATEGDVNYYSGASGTFTLTPAVAAQPGVAVLTASYLDHGNKEDKKGNLQGKMSVVVRVK